MKLSEKIKELYGGDHAEVDGVEIATRASALQALALEAEKLEYQVKDLKEHNKALGDTARRAGERSLVSSEELEKAKKKIAELEERAERNQEHRLKDLELIKDGQINGEELEAAREIISRLQGEVQHLTFSVDHLKYEAKNRVVELGPGWEGWAQEDIDHLRAARQKVKEQAEELEAWRSVSGPVVLWSHVNEDGVMERAALDMRRVIAVVKDHHGDCVFWPVGASEPSGINIPGLADRAIATLALLAAHEEQATGQAGPDSPATPQRAPRRPTEFLLTVVGEQAEGAAGSLLDSFCDRFPSSSWELIFKAGRS